MLTASLEDRRHSRLKDRCLRQLEDRKLRFLEASALNLKRKAVLESRQRRDGPRARRLHASGPQGPLGPVLKRQRSPLRGFPLKIGRVRTIMEHG